MARKHRRMKMEKQLLLKWSTSTAFTSAKEARPRNKMNKKQHDYLKNTRRLRNWPRLEKKVVSLLRRKRR